MERHGFEWEHKGTHEKHLSVLDYEKKVEELTEQLLGKDCLIDKQKSIIVGLKNKISELEEKLSSRDSIREQMECGRLKSENYNLRKENQKLRDVLTTHGIPLGRKQMEREER